MSVRQQVQEAVWRLRDGLGAWDEAPGALKDAHSGASAVINLALVLARAEFERLAEAVSAEPGAEFERLAKEHEASAPSAAPGEPPTFAAILRTVAEAVGADPEAKAMIEEFGDALGELVAEMTLPARRPWTTPEVARLPLHEIAAAAREVRVDLAFLDRALAPGAPRQIGADEIRVVLEKMDAELSKVADLLAPVLKMIDDLEAPKAAPIPEAPDGKPEV